MSHPLYPPTMHPMSQPPARHGALSVISAVIGTVSLLLCFVPSVVLLVGGMSLVGLALSIIALVTGSSNGHRADFAIAGAMTNGASFVVFTLAMVSVAAGIVQ